MSIRNKLRSKAAFSMLELILVIVILGFIAALGLPRLENDPLREAADQLVRHIRYTQQLALSNGQYASNDSVYYKKRWQLRFRRLLNENGYVIFADSKSQQGNSDDNEKAIDPQTGRYLDGFDDTLDTKALNLTTSYGIKGDTTGVVVSCFQNDGSLVTSNRGVIAFDDQGRPYAGVTNATSPFQYLLTSNCIITLKNNANREANITVVPETGYTYISAFQE